MVTLVMVAAAEFWGFLAVMRREIFLGRQRELARKRIFLVNYKNQTEIKLERLLPYEKDNRELVLHLDSPAGDPGGEAGIGA